MALEFICRATGCRRWGGGRRLRRAALAFSERSEVEIVLAREQLREIVAQASHRPRRPGLVTV